MNRELKAFYDFNYGVNAKIPETAFTLFTARAVSELDRITDGRFSELPPCDAKFVCILDAAEILYEESQTGNIQSENNDGYSVTYKNSDSKTPQKRIYEMAKSYLHGSGILYRGLDGDN